MLTTFSVFFPYFWYLIFQMSKKVNIKTIAADLNVSPSTVSKALKDSHEISEKTRKKIQAYAKYYNYKPNSLALSLRNQRTMTLGLIVPEIVHHFFSRVIYGVESIANEKDYNLMICLSKDSLEKEKQNIDMLTNGSVDGLLISVAKETFEKSDFSHFERLLDQGFPIVFFDRVPDNINTDKVVVDDVAGGYKATMHLIEKGLKKIGILSTPPHVTIGNNREIGYRKALKENKIDFKDSYTLHIDEKEDISQQIGQLLKSPDRPQGIFAVNEKYAAITLQEAKKLNINIPEDLSVIGFTDGYISKYTSPTLTTIAQHGYTMGAKSAEMLLKKLLDNKKNTSNQTYVISTNVVKREST